MFGIIGGIVLFIDLILFILIIDIIIKNVKNES